MDALRVDWKPFTHEDGRPSAQAKILACGAFEACAGGIVGGGKTSALLAGPLRWIHRAGFAALILRRNYTDLTKADGLIERAAGMYRAVGGESHNGGIAWTWPSGARIDLAGMDREEDRFKYDGSAYQFCVARGTPILMGDGTWRAIEAIQVGDVVATLIGPRPVTRLHRPGRKRVVRVTTSAGQTLVSESHRVLTSLGWASPAEVMSKRSSGFASTSRASRPPCRASSPPLAAQPADPLRDAALPSRALEGTASRTSTGASREGDRIGCRASADERRGDEQPASWSVQLVLLARALHRDPRASALSSRDHAAGRDRSSTAGLEGSPIGCRASRDSDGGPPLHEAAADLGSTRPPSDVDEGHRASGSSADGLASTRARTRTARPALLHPYSSAPLDLVEDVQLHAAEMAPAGEAEVLDLTVAEASHYVAWGGIISSNCAFDQLETFTERQYTYMASRMRQNDRILAGGGEPIPLRLRSSATPGGPHPDWVIARFAPWIRAKDPTWTGYRAQDGERVYYRFDEVKGEQVICDADHPDARSRTHFTTELIETLVGKEYVLSLDTLDPLTRAQRKFGNWLIRPGSGLFFTAESFSYVDAPPIRVRARARGWDLAATPKKPGDVEGKGAATAGVLMSIDHKGEVYIEHVARAWERPGAVEDLIVNTCHADDEEIGEPVLVDLPLDPGQAARHQREAYARRLEGRYWRMTPEVGEKTNRIKPLSAHASRSPLRLVRGPWNEAFTKELIAFPYGLKDQGDAASRAYAACLRMPALVPSRDGDRAPKRETARGFGGY